MVPPTLFSMAVLLAALAVGCARTGSTPRPEPKPITYVALGASDSVGVGTRRPDVEGWVPRLSARLGTGTRTVNLGVSGSTLDQALLEQLGPAREARPDVVTVWLAVNDFNARRPLEQYGAELNQLLAALNGTGALVLVGNIPDIAALPVYASLGQPTVAAEVERWNRVIQQAAASNGATLVDLYAQWQELRNHPEYVSADGFHPSAEGYQRLADVFAESLPPDLRNRG
ncbi:MAG: SGNH/GDSL hydrolase family protein [Chloroflexi bacterium]|nr:SGNH/GDSL hydrolase family protein [Chloroflexota bacterium]